MRLAKLTDTGANSWISFCERVPVTTKAHQKAENADGADNAEGKYRRSYRGSPKNGENR
jgi:hypothetical protein